MHAICFLFAAHRMHLLFVHECFGNHDGAEANVFATATALKRRGHRVGLLTQRRTGRNEAAWEELFGQRIFWHGIDGGEALKQFRPDLIYVHKWDDQPSTERLLASTLPLVRMVHDHDLYCLRGDRCNPLTGAICRRPLGSHCVLPCLAPLKRDRGGRLPVRWASFFAKKREVALARNFDRHIVATRYMREELLRNGFSGDRITIQAPVPPPAELLRSRFSDRNLLIFAGPIIRGKGVDVMLRALAQVGGRFEVVVLGEGGDRARCEKLSRRLGLADRVKFKGHVASHETRTFYQEATAMLVPSVWPEPMGLVGLEAMRHALPVIAFDVGGIGEWLRDGENGFLVPWMDAAGFAQCIDNLLADKEKARQMGRRGFERSLLDFDFNSYINSLEDLFTEVACEPRLAARSGGTRLRGHGAGRIGAVLPGRNSDPAGISYCSLPLRSAGLFAE